MRGWMGASTSSGTNTWIAETSRRPWPRRRLQATSRRGFCPRSRTRRSGSRRSSPGPRAKTPCRSCWEGTTRWPSARWAGLAEVHGPGGTIWIDAHGDLNSPDTSPSGNVHGMVLAAVLGLAGDRFRGDGWGLPAVSPGRVALVGVRSLDDGERKVLGELDAKVFTMSDVDRLGIERAIRESLTHVAGPRLRPCESRHGCDGSRGGRRASARRCAAVCRTAKRTSPWS